MVNNTWRARLGRLSRLGRHWLAALDRPPCLLCTRPTEATGLCDGCRHDLPWNLAACRHCALPLPLPSSEAAAEAQDGHLCPDCQHAPPPITTLAPLRYGFPVDALVAGLKYHGRLSHAPVLGALLQEAVQAAGRPAPDLLLPVPLHPARLAERGYNQALELARPLARAYDRPLETTLVRRIRATAAQRGLDARARRRNLRAAFTLNPARLAMLPRPCHIALIDDVSTTGSTLAAIAGLLLAEGLSVEAWVVARTP